MAHTSAVFPPLIRTIATGAKCTLLLQLKSFAKDARMINESGEKQLFTLDFDLKQHIEHLFDDINVIIKPFLHYVEIVKEIILYVDSYTLQESKPHPVFTNRETEQKLIITQYLSEHALTIDTTIGPLVHVQMFVKEI